MKQGKFCGNLNKNKSDKHIKNENGTDINVLICNWFIAVDCGNPGIIENGRVIIVNGTTYNRGIEYHCVPGYTRNGPYLRKCMENGEWSGDQPLCHGKYCYFESESHESSLSICNVLLV